MRRFSKSPVLLLVAGMVLGAIALGIVQAATSVTSDVRIGARLLDDGRVEVGLQQQQDGEWVGLEPPSSRFLPPTATRGEWHYSNEIAVTGVTQDEATVVIVRRPPVMCVLGHAYPADDRFWQWTLATSRVVGIQYGIDLRLYAASDSDDHAADLRDCIASEPIAIATSLPYAEDLAEPLAEAREAGILVVTFNSGADDADSVNSLLHIGLDDYNGGVQAGAELNDAGVTGTVLCVIHETDNVGLRQRCEGLEAGYAGEVEEMFVDLLGPTELEEVQGLLANRIAAGDIGGIVTLNHDTGTAALAAVAEAEAEIALASFGFSDTLAAAVRDGDMLFLVWDHPVIQGYLAVSAMAMAFTLELSDLNSGVFLNGAKILIEPTLADQERAAELQSMFRFADRLRGAADSATDGDDSSASPAGGEESP
ncbi:MAG: substrate-binding domain-containing protein [Chloroflexi bacterium]|nr:substrate-binding domain-containing protein [Chloroflexota bacterium]MYD17349.1 substrate-binding domain-containing protein [Chloroflexota bacterium]MYJ02020.1 substrate-binding domain-containing protein [Chloroflexota bacterium]